MIAFFKKKINGMVKMMAEIMKPFVANMISL